jgi:hypothetical protein
MGRLNRALFRYGGITREEMVTHPFYQLFKVNRYARLDLDGAPRASPWSPITLPDYANGH